MPTSNVNSISNIIFTVVSMSRRKIGIHNSTWVSHDGGKNPQVSFMMCDGILIPGKLLHFMEIASLTKDSNSLAVSSIIQITNQRKAFIGHLYWISLFNTIHRIYEGMRSFLQIRTVFVWLVSACCCDKGCEASQKEMDLLATNAFLSCIRKIATTSDI